MTRRAQTQDGETVALKTGRLSELRRQFETAWQMALTGGEQPSLEDYLVGSPDTERLELRDELERIDLTYRQALSDPLAPTLGFVPTAEREAPVPPGSHATINYPS